MNTSTPSTPSTPSTVSQRRAPGRGSFAASASLLRPLLLALPLALGLAPCARAQVSVGIGIEAPGVSIGLSFPAYPQLVRVPGYPVYYAPRAGANYFFYDGLYWVYQDDRWYASGWYNGPWRLVEPVRVPVYILRVPVRYYPRPPAYFQGWHRDAPPPWGRHWGRHWEDQRRGWDKWDRHAAPPPAPLPTYQREYKGERYPREAERQQAIRSANYPYRSRDEAGRPDDAPPGRGAAEHAQGPAPAQARSEPGGKDHGGKGKAHGHDKKKD